MIFFLSIKKEKSCSKVIHSVFAFLKKRFFIGVQLLCSVVLGPVVQHSEPAVRPHTCPVFWTSMCFFSPGVPAGCGGAPCPLPPGCAPASGPQGCGQVRASVCQPVQQKVSVGGLRYAWPLGRKRLSELKGRHSSSCWGWLQGDISHTRVREGLGAEQGRELGPVAELGA